MNVKTISVILTDDHLVVRNGLISMLAAYPDICIAGQAGNGSELKSLLASIRADVVVLDIELPDSSGLELCGYIRSEHPGTQVLILSMYTGEEYIFKAIAQGASGYLPKNTSKEELSAAIRALAKGEDFFSPVISEIMLSGYVKKAKSNQTGLQSLNELTKREVAILTMIADGITHQDIAEKLFISVRTVESHKSHIMQKLDLHTTAELVKFAIRQKLIEI